MDLGRNNKIDTKLLALINNDAFIKGTRNLAGAEFEQTISYLKHFMTHRQNTGFIEGLFSLGEERKGLEALVNRIDSLALASEEINKIIKNLRNVPDSVGTFGGLYKNEEALESTINNGAQPFVSRLMKLNKSTDPFPNSVLMPGGWLGTPGKSGYAIAYEFKKDKNGDYIFLVYNSGAGLQFHENVTTAEKDKYKTVKAYKIPGAATEAELNYFVSELIKPNTLPLVQGRDSKNIVEYNSKILYEEVFRKISYLKGEEIPLQEAELIKSVQELASVGQRAGTCAEKVLQELMKLNIRDKKKTKALIFLFKLFSNEEFIEQHKNSMDDKKVSQLKWSVQNLSKLLLKEKDNLPEYIQERAKKALEQAQELLEKSKKELTQSQTLKPIENLSAQKVTAENINLSRAPTVAVVSSKKKIIEQKFNPNKVSFSSDVISAKVLDLDKLYVFKVMIESLESQGLYKDAEEELFNYFTQAPLIDRNYFSSIKNPAEAIEYVELTNFLSSKYMNMIRNQNKGELHDNPKKTAVILNVAESLDMLYKRDVLKFVDNSGIDSLYNSAHGLNNFKKNRVNNAYLSTEISSVDNRTKNIIQRQESSTAIDLDAFMDYINRPTNNDFKNFLVGLFDKVRSPDIFDSELKNFIKNQAGSSWYDGFKNRWNRNENDRKAIAAYFRYFNENECGAYKNELDKLNLFKKMKVCCQQLSTAYPTDSLNISNETIFNPMKYQSYNKVMEYNEGINIKVGNIFLIDERLKNHFTQINDQNNVNSLQIDINTSEETHKPTYQDNEIFFYPEGVKVDGDQVVQSEHGRLHQELMHLRTAPDLQIMTTVDFFKDKLHLFANKITEGDKDNRVEKDNILKNDMQQYLRRNLFQPGLLLKELQRNPESYDVIQDNFINKGILFFTKNKKITDETLYFYDLQQDINNYALNSPNFSSRKNQIYTEMAITYKTLNEINEGELSQIERYELSKIKLKTQLILLDHIKDAIQLDSQKEEHFKKLFQAYMDFSSNSRDVVLDSAEKRDQLKQLKYKAIEMLKENPNLRDKTFDWTLEYIKNNNLATKSEFEEIEKAALKNKSGSFPYFYVKSDLGEELVATDMLEGLVLVKGNYFCYPPDILVNSPVYKSICGTEYPRMSVAIMSKTDTGENVKVYQALGNDNIPGRFVEAGRFAKASFVYQQFKSFRNEQRYCEKRVLSNNKSDLSLMTQLKENVSLDISLNLPESFYSSETECWVACDNQKSGAIYIEKTNGKYVVDLEPNGQSGAIKELDENKKETGFILSTNYQDPKLKSVLNVFKGFDDPQFTEILFKPTNDVGKNVEEIKIKFPRYNLELEGKFDVKEQKWEIFQKNNPDLILVDDQHIQIKPKIDISNNLIFENKKNKQRFLYTPIQNHYINPQDKYNENLSDTVYYKPKLDTNNVSKRMLQGKTAYPSQKKSSLGLAEALLARQNQMLQPAGATTYSNSEEFRVFPIDSATQELKTATSEDTLHLAYLNLINLQPEEALNSIRSIIKMGGLKGTVKELELIEKIFNRTPLDGSSLEIDSSLRIDSPEFVAVRTHILYLISDLYAKKDTFSLPNLDKMEIKTPDDFIKKSQIKILKSFETAIPELMHEHLNLSLNLHSATPKEMRLPKTLEYKMMPRLENGYSLGLLSVPDMSRERVELLNQYITDPPVLIQSKSSSKQNSKPEYWLIGRDKYGNNKITSIKDMDLMNTLPFKYNLEKLGTVYVSEEKNRDLFLEIESKQAHNHQSKTVPIQARYEHLKNWYRTRELAKINKPKDEDNKRKELLEQKTKRKKSTSTYEKRVETKTIQIPLVSVIKGSESILHDKPDYTEFSFSTNELYPGALGVTKEIIAKGDPRNPNRSIFDIQSLRPNMTDKKFLEHIIPIIELAKSTDSKRSIERNKLKDFLENTLKANCKILPEKQQSLIRNWAPSLLTAMKSPNSFSHINLKDEYKKTFNTSEWSYTQQTWVNVSKTIDGNPNRHEDFVKSFMAQAFSINSNYSIQIKDYKYYLKEDFDISSKQFKKEKYVPQHMKVEPSAIYKNLTYEDFIDTAELNPFCISIKEIKQNTEIEVDKLKISLDMVIRDSLLKQSIELLKAEIKFKEKQGATESELLVLKEQLKTTEVQYQDDLVIINEIKQKISENFKKDISDDVLLERLQLISKFRQLTKEGKYQDTAEIKRQYDEKIGALRNEEGEKVYESTCNLLEKETVREKATKTCLAFISTIDPKLNNLEKTLIRLANSGPKNPEAQQKYQRELQARKREPLNFNDLNRLFVTSDKNEYKKITGLDDDDIDVLHQSMAEYINLGILKQQYTRMESTLSKTETSFFSDPVKINEIIQLGRVIATNNMISLTGSADIQFFQKEENILITPLQKFYLDILLNKDDITDEYRSEVIQLIMGGGKSKVLGPLSMLKKADGKNLAIFQVKNSLLKTNFADMNATSRRLFNQEAVLFEFDRNSPSSSKDLKALFDLFHKTSLNKGYVVTSGTSLQSLELKYLETLEAMPENKGPHDAEYKEWAKKIKWFERSLDFIQYKGDRIIDEVHDELDSNKELNYTIGDAVPPSKEDIKLTIDTIYFLREVSLGKKELGLDKEIKAFDLIYNNKFITDPKNQMAGVMDKIASHFINNPNATNTNPIGKIITKLDLKNDNEKQALKSYLLNQNAEFLPVLKSKLTEREMMDVAFVKSQLSKFLPVTLLKNYNENYGPSRKEGITQIQRKLAIPYTDLNTPNEKSRFGEFTESMNYTVFMNIIESISTELVNDLIKEYIEKAQTEQVDSLDAKFENTSANIEYNVKFGKVLKPTLEQIRNYVFDQDNKLIGDPKIISNLFFDGNPTPDELEEILSKAEEEQAAIFSSENKFIKISETEISKQFDIKYRLNKEPKVIELKEISTFNKNQLDCLVSVLKDSDDFKKVILSDYVLKQVENNPIVLTNNTQDLGGMTNTTQAMSGTPHNFKAYNDNIHFDEYQGLGTDGETISLLKNRKTPVVDSSAYESVIGLLDEYLNNKSVDKNVRRNTRAIIDAGALFKKEKSNFNIAKQIGDYAKDNPKKFSCEIKYVLYCENKGDVLHAWDIKNNKKIKLATSDEKEISKILDCTPEERFTLYDQARITGTDIVQARGENQVTDIKTGNKTSFFANAIVTFSEKTTKSSFLQAVKRMRHDRQTVSVIKADYLKKRLPKDNDIDEVLSFVNQVQVDKALQLHFKSTGHKFKNALRKNFMRKIRNQTDLETKNQLLDTFKPVFYKNFQPNHFLNHGAVETEQDAILYFPVMAEKYYDQWEKLIEEAQIEVTDQEREQMKETLVSLANKAIDICETTFKAKPIERISSDMAQDDNIGNEVENELQNELEIQLQMELELEKELITYDKTKQKYTGGHYTLGFNADPVKEGDAQLFSMKQVISTVPFDDNIFMTARQRQTVAGAYNDSYYGQHVKPFHVTMMMAQKNKPETLQCVILTKEEAQAEIQRGIKDHPHKDVWFVSCHDTVLYGKKPKWLESVDNEPKPEDLSRYNRVLEQIRYVNGDLGAILQQKHGISWLNVNSKEKVDFIASTILKRFPESNKYFSNLKSRLDVTSKIFNHMQAHPFKNYLDEKFNWDEISKGFSDTADPESLAKIKIFAQALHDINTIYENNHLDSKLSKAEIEKNHDQHIAYRLNQHKENFLDKRTRIIEALSKNQPLDFALSEQFKDIDLNFLVNKKTLFEIALNKFNSNLTPSFEILFKKKTKDKDDIWLQKNGDPTPKNNAELLVLHAIERNTKERKNINDTLLEITGGKNKDPDKTINLIKTTDSNINLLILAVKYNNLPLLKCIEEEYLSVFDEKLLKDILQKAQKSLTSESLPEIRKLIQIHGKEGDLVEKHKRLRTVVFDKIEKWIDSDYDSQIKIDFSKRPFSTSKLDFDGFTDEDKIYIKSVIDKLVENPNKSICEYFNRKEVFKQPNMLDKKTVLTDVITHAEKLLDKDLNDIITILVSNQADVKYAFALALESKKSKSVLGHLKAQNGVSIYFDPDKPETKKQFLLLRNYKTDSTEEIVRKLNVCHELNADFSRVLDYKGNAILHNLCFLEHEQKKLEQIIPALSSSESFDINSKNTAGSTALHMAISSGNVAMVKNLLAQKDEKKQDKVDIDIQDANNKTAMDLVTDALQKDEKYSPEIVTLISEAYQRKHKDNYLEEIPVEKMLAEEIWVYLNDVLYMKPDLQKDKTLVSRMIHAHSRNEDEFNINKSELYQYIKNDKLENKFSVHHIKYIELYDNIQFDKNLLGVEQKIEGFDAPKLAEIKKEKIDEFPEKWAKDDLIALKVLQEYEKSDCGDGEQSIATFIRDALDKYSQTIEDFYNAKKTFISHVTTLAELPAEEAIFDKQNLNKVLVALKRNPHKFFPSYKASEQIKTTEVKSQEYTDADSAKLEKDWDKIAHGYLADVITSGQYLNIYQNIPFNDFISGNASTQEEFDKLKSETKKYLNLVFQDTIQEKEFVIGALDKVSFKPKIENKVTSPSDSNIEQEQTISTEVQAEQLFEKIQSLPNGFDNSNLSIIVEFLHEMPEAEKRFSEVRNELRELIGKKDVANVARVRRMLYGIEWDSSLPQKIIVKRKAEALEKEKEAKKLEEASKNPKTENAGLVSAGQPQIIEKSVTAQNKNIKSTKFYDKNYSVIAREIYNFAVPFTNNYEKSFDPAYKIKLKEHAKTQEDFDEINNELKVLFKKQLTPEQTKIATAMLNSVKATDLGFKASASKVEVKAPVSPQTSQQPKLSTVVTPPVEPQPTPPVVTTEQPKSSVSVPISTPSTPDAQPTSPVVIPKSLTTGAILVSQLEDCLPNKFDEMQQLDKEIQAELKRLSLLTDISPEEIKDLNNARDVIKSFMKYKELIGKESQLSQMSQIPPEVIKDLFNRAEKAVQQSDKADFDFAYGYLNRARNILTTKIGPSLFKLDTLLRSDKPIKDDDIKLYSMYLNDLELLHAGYEQLEDVEERHKLFGKTKVTYDEQGNKKTKGLLSLISHHHARVMEIEQITSDACNLIANISATDRAKLFPKKLNSFTHFESLITLLKDKSGVSATNARKREEVYASTPKQPTTIVQPSSPVVPTQQEINLIKIPEKPLSPSAINPTSPNVVPQKLTTAAELIAQIETYVPDQLDRMKLLDKEMYQELKNLALLKSKPENNAFKQDLEKNYTDLKHAREILEVFKKFSEFTETEQSLQDTFNRIPQSFIQDLEQRIEAEKSNPSIQKDLIFAKEYIERARSIPSKIKLALPELNNLLKTNQGVGLNKLSNYVQYLTELETLTAEYTKFQKIANTHDFDNKYAVPDGEFNGIPKELKLMTLMGPCFQRIMRIKDLTSDTCNLISNASKAEQFKFYPNTKAFFVNFEQNMNLLKDKSAEISLHANEREMALAYDDLIEKIKITTVDEKNGLSIEQITEFEDLYSKLDKKGKKPVIDNEDYEKLSKSLKLILNADASWDSWFTVGKTVLKSNLIGLTAEEEKQQKSKKIQLENYKKLQTSFEKLGKKLQSETEQKEKHELIKDYNTHATNTQELLNDVGTLQYLEKRQSYKKFNMILSAAENFYDNNKANTFFADPEKSNLHQKIKDLILARTNVLTSVISDMEEKVVAKPKNTLTTHLQAEKLEFEQMLNDLNDPDLIYATFEQKDKDKLIAKIKGKIQDIEKLINPSTPPVQPPQSLSTTSALTLNFDMELHCKASAWHNNCALNCLTHFVYSKLESNGIQTHFNNDPAYNLLRESFKEYYNLATTPTWEQIKTILDDYSVAHDREAVLAPVFRVYLSKVIVKEKDAIWNTEASAAISDYLVTGDIADVAKTIIGVNKTEMIELKKQFDAEIRGINPASFTQQEKERAKQKIDAWNKHKDITTGARKVKDPNSTAVINDQIFIERRILIEDKYGDIAKQKWKKENGFCDVYAKHMANMSNGELVSVNQLGLIATQLGIGLEVFTTTHKYELGADVRSQASKDWILKAYNPSEIHWEYEEPTHSKAKTIQHNQDYTEINNSVFKTYGSARPVADEEIKKMIVRKYIEKGFNIPSVPAQNTGDIPSIPPTMPNVVTKPQQSVQVQPTLPTSSPFDANVIADKIYQEAKILTQDFTLNITGMFAGKINAKVSNETEFNAVVKVLKEEVLNLYLDQEPTKLNLAIGMLGKPKYVPKVSSQSTQPSVSTNVAEQTPRWSASFKANEILLQVIAETDNFKNQDISKSEKLEEMFAERLNLYAKNQDEFDKIVTSLGVETKSNDFEKGRIYYYLLNKQGLDDSIIRKVKRAADVNYKPFKGTEQERKQAIEGLRAKYQSNPLAKTLSDAREMANDILLIAMNETDNFKKTASQNIQDTLSIYLSEYTYTQEEFDGVIEALLGSSSNKKGLIDNEFNLRKNENVDPNHKAKELFKQLISTTIAKKIYDKIILVSGNLEDASNTYIVGRLHEYAKSEQQFNDIKQEFSKLVTDPSRKKVILTIPFNPTTIGIKALQSANLSTSSGLSPTQPNVPVTTPNIPIQTQPQPIVTQPVVVVSQQSSGIPPTQFVPVSNPVPVQQPPTVVTPSPVTVSPQGATSSQQAPVSVPQSVIGQGTDSSVQQSPTGMPQGTVPQQVATGTNQVTPSTPPVVTQPQQSGEVKPTQSMPVSNPAQTQQQSPTVVVAQPAVTVPQQGTPLVESPQYQQTPKPTQAFLPGFSGQSGVNAETTVKSKTPEEIAEELFSEIIQKIPDSFDNKNSVTIGNLIYQNSHSDAEFNEVRNALRECVSKHEVPRAAAVRRMLNLIEYHTAVLNFAKQQQAVPPVQQTPSKSVVAPTQPLVPPTQSITVNQNPVPTQQIPKVITQPPVMPPSQQSTTINQGTTPPPVQQTPSKSVVAPTQPLVPPTQSITVNQNPVPMQQTPKVITQPPVMPPPQQSTTINQGTTPPPVQQTPSKPAVVPTQPLVPSTQSITINQNPVPMQQTPKVITQPPVMPPPQQSTMINQGTTPPVQQTPSKPVVVSTQPVPVQSTQAFIPGFTAQSGAGNTQLAANSTEPKTPEEIAEILFSEIMQKIPDGFDSKNSAAISNLIHQNSSSEAEFNEIKNALRESVSTHDVPRAAAVRRMLYAIECHSQTLNPAAKVKKPGF